MGAEFGLESDVHAASTGSEEEDESTMNDESDDSEPQTWNPCRRTIGGWPLPLGREADRAPTLIPCVRAVVDACAAKSLLGVHLADVVMGAGSRPGRLPRMTAMRGCTEMGVQGASATLGG